MVFPDPTPHELLSSPTYLEGRNALPEGMPRGPFQTTQEAKLAINAWSISLRTGDGSFGTHYTTPRTFDSPTCGATFVMECS